MEIVFDTQTITEAGFDTYLVRALFPEGSNVSIQTIHTDASSLSGGIIGGQGIFYLGSKQFKFDGKNRRMTIADGVNDRLLAGGF